MPVRVRPVKLRVGVHVLMMDVVIVEMFVLDRLMRVQMLMMLCREGNQSDSHQTRRDPINCAWPLSEQRHRDQSTDEWRRGEVGGLTSSPHQTHRFQCENQA